MIRYVVITVRDRSADCFAQPSYATSVGSAARSFADQINDPASGMLHKHPEDFDLYELGFYDDTTGSFELHDRPRQVVLGKDCVKK